MAFCGGLPESNFFHFFWGMVFSGHLGGGANGTWSWTTLPCQDLNSSARWVETLPPSLLLNGGFHKWRIPNSWRVFLRTILFKWMIWGYPLLMETPHGNWPAKDEKFLLKDHLWVALTHLVIVPKLDFLATTTWWGVFSGDQVTSQAAATRIAKKRGSGPTRPAVDTPRCGSPHHDHGSHRWGPGHVSQSRRQEVRPGQAWGTFWKGESIEMVRWVRVRSFQRIEWYWMLEYPKWHFDGLDLFDPKWQIWDYRCTIIHHRFFDSSHGGLTHPWCGSQKLQRNDYKMWTS